MTISPSSPSLSPMPKSSSPRRSSISHHGGAPPGFRVPTKPWGPTRAISQMSVRELHEALERNARMLQALGASTSASVERITKEQDEIKERLLEVEGVEDIRTRLQDTSIDPPDNMNIDQQQPTQPRMLSAKQRALANFGSTVPLASGIGRMTYEEAVQLEQRAHHQDAERRERILERKKRQGLPIKGEVLSREERDARMRAFLMYKPTDSDLEDDDEDDDDDDDDDDDEKDNPQAWWDDEDGTHGAPFVDSSDFDGAGLNNIIRIDNAKAYAGYSTFYEPKDDF